jgi:hypothetical protein
MRRVAAVVPVADPEPVRAVAAAAEAGEAVVREPVGEPGRAAAEVQRVQAATAAAPVRGLESAPAAVSEPEPDPVQRWALVSVPAPMPPSAPARRHPRVLVLRPPELKPAPAPVSARARLTATVRATEPGTREPGLRTGPVSERRSNFRLQPYLTSRLEQADSYRAAPVFSLVIIVVGNQRSATAFTSSFRHVHGDRALLRGRGSRSSESAASAAIAGEGCRLRKDRQGGKDPKAFPALPGGATPAGVPAPVPGPDLSLTERHAMIKLRAAAYPCSCRSGPFFGL